MRTLVLVISAAALAGCVDAQEPRIEPPRPAPVAPSELPPLAPAEIDNSLAIGGEAVKAHKAESRMTVDVHLNGRGPYRFVVDSGADTSVVGLRVARDLQLPVGTSAVLNSMTARNVVDRVKLDSMTVGPTTTTGLMLPALREEYVGAQGLIGIDALVQQRLLMDFEKHVIKVDNARKPMKYEPGAIVIVAKRRRGQLILTHVRAGGVSLDAVIDTGSEVTIGNTALRDKLLRRGTQTLGTMDITGVTGATMKVQMVMVDELQLGPIRMQNVPIAFADVPPFDLFGLAGEPALLIGTDLLENFRRVSLDFHARKVRFQLKRCEATGFSLRATSSHTASLLSSRDPHACEE
jgi:predicted aspartyl protease